MKALVTLTLLAASVCIGLTPPALAYQRESPPQGGMPKPLALPEITTYRLSNDVSVTLVPHGRVPKVSVKAVVRVGQVDDGDRPRISQLAGAMLREGADGRAADDIAVGFAAMGGELSIGVDNDHTIIGTDVLAENAPAAIAMIAAILQRPTFSESAFERVKQDQVRVISLGMASSRTVADDAFLRAMYPDHPYGRAVLPDPAAFAQLALNDVKAFYAANFGGQRTHVYVVGQFDAEAVRRAIIDGFGQWTRGAPAPSRLPALPKQTAVTLVDRPGAVQSTIRLGKRVPPIDQSVDLEAANMLLGGYFSSRITMNIREDKGYTYSPYSKVGADKGAAYWVQSADITREATGAALAEIVGEIRRLATVPPSQAELRAVKNYMNGIFAMQLASRPGMLNKLAYIDLHGLGADYLRNYASRIEALSPQAVQAAVGRNLSLDAMTLVVVGDLMSVRPQLEAELWPELPIPH